MARQERPSSKRPSVFAKLRRDKKKLQLPNPKDHSGATRIPGDSQESQDLQREIFEFGIRSAEWGMHPTKSECFRPECDMVLLTYVHLCADMCGYVRLIRKKLLSGRRVGAFAKGTIISVISLISATEAEEVQSPSAVAALWRDKKPNVQSQGCLCVSVSLWPIRPAIVLFMPCLAHRSPAQFSP
jgi:hypothetical protein